MEILGKVIKVLPVESGVSKSGNEWKRATIVVEVADNSPYPRSIAMRNLKKADEFSRIPIGTYGKFFADVESREANGKYYTDVTCWRWETGAQQQPQYAPQPAMPQPQPQYAPQPSVPPPQSNGFSAPNDEPLPF